MQDASVAKITWLGPVQHENKVGCSYFWSTSLALGQCAML